MRAGRCSADRAPRRADAAFLASPDRVDHIEVVEIDGGEVVFSGTARSTPLARGRGSCARTWAASIKDFLARCRISRSVMRSTSFVRLRPGVFRSGESACVRRVLVAGMHVRVCSSHPTDGAPTHPAPPLPAPEAAQDGWPRDGLDPPLRGASPARCTHAPRSAGSCTCRSARRPRSSAASGPCATATTSSRPTAPTATPWPEDHAAERVMAAVRQARRLLQRARRLDAHVRRRAALHGRLRNRGRRHCRSPPGIALACDQRRGPRDRRRARRRARAPQPSERQASRRRACARSNSTMK